MKICPLCEQPISDREKNKYYKDKEKSNEKMAPIMLALMIGAVVVVVIGLATGDISCTSGVK